MLWFFGWKVEVVRESDGRFGGSVAFEFSRRFSSADIRRFIALNAGEPQVERDRWILDLCMRFSQRKCEISSRVYLVTVCCIMRLIVKSSHMQTVTR